MALAERASGVDLEALEGVIREAVLEAGAKMLETLLHDVPETTAVVTAAVIAGWA